MTGNTVYNAIQIIAVAAIPLIFAITLHEAAHGWIASKFGDNTALMMGRVTLNPVKHIDPIGTIVFPIIVFVVSGFNFIFGWAKPVPINWQALGKPRRDMAFVALAGPAANLVMALLWALIAKGSLFLVYYPNINPYIRLAMQFFSLAALIGINLNIALMILNLIPIPPLDGSRVISSILPPRLSLAYERIEPYGIWILLGLLAFGVLGRMIWPPLKAIVTLIKGLFGLP